MNHRVLACREWSGAYGVVMALVTLAFAAAGTDRQAGAAGPVPATATSQADPSVLASIPGLPPEAKVFANRPGFCVDLGCGDGKLACEIAARTKLTVLALAKDDADCDRTRQALDKAGLYGTRATALTGSLAKIPLPTGFANLLVTGEYQEGIDLREVLRVLSPNGQAVVGGGRADANRLRAAVEAAGIRDFRMAGNCAIFRGRMPTGADDWTHMRHGPDNNRVSADASIKPPFRTQWLVPMPPFSGDMVFVQNMVAAQGRMLLLKGVGKDIRLCCWDAFNGTFLWAFPAERENLPLLMTGVVAVGDRVYAAAGDRAVALDAATGQIAQVYRVLEDPDIRGKWAWLAVTDGLLLAQAEGADGKAVYPHSTGCVFFALDLKTGELLWKHACKGLALTDTAVVGGGALYFRDEAAGAVAVDLKTGKERWVNADLAGKAEQVDGKPQFFYDWECTSIGLAGVYGDGKVHFINGKVSVMLDAKDGHKLWAKDDRNWRANCMYPAFIGKTMYTLTNHNSSKGTVALAEIDSATGAAGKSVTGQWSGCGAGVFSASTVFNTGQGFAAIDINTGQGYAPARVFRSPCGNGPLPSQGLLFMMPMKCGCLYPVSLPAALAPVTEPSLPDGRADLAGRLSKGPAYDVSAPVEGAAEDWPCWQGGPGHTGQVGTAPKLPLKVGWQQNLGGSLTPPSAGGGLVYVGSRQGWVRGLDQASGEVRWKFGCGGEVPVTPAYHTGRLLFGSADGHVYCLEAKTGRLAWKFRAAPGQCYINRIGRVTSLWPVDSGVVADKGVAYFVAGSLAYDGVWVYAADVATGKIRWVTESDAHCGGPIALAGELLIVPGSGKHQTRAFKTTDGSVVPWFDKAPTCPRGAMGYAAVHASAIVAEGSGYLSGGSPKLRPRDVEPFALCETETGFAEGWVASAKEKRFVTTPLPFPLRGPATPILTGTVVIQDAMACERGKFAALNLRGRLTKGADPREELEAVALWSAQPWPEDTKPLILAHALAGNVYLAANGPEVVAIEAAKGGKELARATVPGAMLRDGLAVSGGRVYVVTEEGTVCCLSGD